MVSETSLLPEMFFRSCNQQILHQAQAQIERGARVRHQVPHHFVVLHEAALQRNLAQHGFQHVFLAGKFFHFAVRQFGSFENGQRHDLGAVANQQRALLFVALQRQLDTAFDVEVADLLQRVLAFGQNVGLLGCQRRVLARTAGAGAAGMAGAEVSGTSVSEDDPRPENPRSRRSPGTACRPRRQCRARVP